MSTEDTEPGPTPSRKEQMQEIARERRLEAYQKSKARAKEAHVAYKSSAAGVEQLAKQKEFRRSAYLKAKDFHKTRKAEQQAKDDAAAALAKEAALSAKMEALMQAVTTGDKVKAKPKLRLVQPDE